MMIEVRIISGMLTAPALAARAKVAVHPGQSARSSTVDHGPVDHLRRPPHGASCHGATGIIAPDRAQARQITARDQRRTHRPAKSHQQPRAYAELMRRTPVMVIGESPV